MVVCTSFDGDHDEELKMFQHKVYYATLRRWVGMAQDRSHHYSGKSSKWDELINLWDKNIGKQGIFDHRCIQMAHDVLAAQFREYILKEMPTAGPLTKKDAWRGFFDTEAVAFMEQEEFLRMFMTALASNSSIGGYDAEEALCDKIQQQYEVVLPTMESEG